MSPAVSGRFSRLGGSVRSLIRSIFWKSYLVGFGATLIVAGGYLYIKQGSATTQVQAATTTTVTRRSIVSAVKAVGSVTFASEQQLKFNQKGTVAKVAVKEGQAVKKGQLLAELDTSSVSADIRQAELSLSASALQLQELQGTQQKQVLDAQNAVNESQRQFQQAQNDLAASQQKLPTDLASAQRSLEEKQSALQQAQLELEKEKTTELQNLASTAQSILTDSDTLLDSYYAQLTREGAARSSHLETGLTVNELLYRDPVLRQQVEFSYNDAAQLSKQLHDQYGESLATERDPKKLLQALSDVHNLAQSLYELGENAYSMLQGASVDTSDFTVSDLNAVRSVVSGNRSKASDLMSQIETAQANLAAASSDDSGIPSVTLKQKQDAVTSAQNALTSAEESVQLLQTTSPNDLQAQQDALQKIQEDYESKQAALNNTSTSNTVDEKLKKNDIAQKSTSVQKALKTLEDYRLVAPFDGIIRRIDYKVGDNLLDTGDTEYATLENPDSLLVTIPLDQVDIVNVRKDMAATITFEALPGKEFQGTVEDIDPTAVVQSGVVSYNVNIKLPTPKDVTILSGMTATVQIETSRADNVLVVPNLALQHQGTQTMVKTANGQSVSVETGKTDGQYTEITSGVTEGQQIVSMNITIAKASSSANANQLFRAGGALGGGGGAGFGGGGGGAGARNFSR